MNNAFFWLLATPILSAPINYLVGRLYVRSNPKHLSANPVRWTSFLSLLVTLCVYVINVQQFNLNGEQTLSYGAITVSLDGLSLVISGIVLVLSVIVVLFSGPYIAGEEGKEKYYALLPILVATMIGLSCATDLFNLWVWFETMAISSFFLVTFYKEQASSLEAGMKYLVQSATGSVLVLFAIALVFGTTGSLDLASLSGSLDTSNPALLLAGGLFIIGYGVKAALVPMQNWLPDAHSQAPSGISAMLSGVVIEAGLVAMLRALAPLNGITHLWGPIIIGFAVINITVGNLMALRQTQVKRMLAYSSLSHVGYMLLGVGIAIADKQLNAAQGSLFHLVNHGMMKGLAFLAAGSLLYALHIARGNHSPLTVDDIAGASRKYPIVALTFSIAVLGLGGLPPFSGFMSKWQIFVAGFQTQSTIIQAIIIYAALNSVLSLGYYAPLVNKLYRHETSEVVNNGAKIPFVMTICLIVLAVGVVALGIFPNWLAWLTEPGARAILSIFCG